MKSFCHLLLVACLLLLAACQPLRYGTSDAMEQPAAPTRLTPPAHLASWQLQGRIGQPFGAPIYMYQLASNPTQSLRISIYPMPQKLQSYTAVDALKRHDSVLALRFKARAAHQLQALNTSMTGHQLLQGGASGLPVINNRFLVTLSNGHHQTTLVSLTLAQGYFIRLTASAPGVDATRLAEHLKQARHQLMTAWFPRVAPQAPTPQ